MDDEAILAEVLALRQQQSGEQCRREYRISAGRRQPLKIPLPFLMPVYKPLSIRRFHGLSAGNALECSLKSRIGKVRYFCDTHMLVQNAKGLPPTGELDEKTLEALGVREEGR